MKLLSAMAALIFIFGVLALLMGIYGLVSVDWQVQLWEDVRRSGVGGPQPFDANGLRSALIRVAIGFLIFGVLAFISSVGMFFRKNWARLLWLATLSLILGLNVLSLAWKYWQDLWESREILGFCIEAVMIAAMFWYFSRAKTKALFVEN